MSRETLIKTGRKKASAAPDSSLSALNGKNSIVIRVTDNRGRAVPSELSIVSPVVAGEGSTVVIGGPVGEEKTKKDKPNSTEAVVVGEPMPFRFAELIAFGSGASYPEASSRCSSSPAGACSGGTGAGDCC